MDQTAQKPIPGSLPSPTNCSSGWKWHFPADSTNYFYLQLYPAVQAEAGKGRSRVGCFLSPLLASGVLILVALLCPRHVPKLGQGERCYHCAALGSVFLVPAFLQLFSVAPSLTAIQDLSSPLKPVHICGGLSGV